MKIDLPFVGQKKMHDTFVFSLILHLLLICAKINHCTKKVLCSRVLLSKMRAPAPTESQWPGRAIGGFIYIHIWSRWEALIGLDGRLFFFFCDKKCMIHSYSLWELRLRVRASESQWEPVAWKRDCPEAPSTSIPPSPSSIPLWNIITNPFLWMLWTL